jgi:hypothetical protein
MAAHRYWRILCHTHAPPPDVYTIQEIQGHTAIGGANVFVGGTAFASSTLGGFVPAFAFEVPPTGNFWAPTSGNNGEWIAYDLGAGNDKDIIEVLITSRGGFGYQCPTSADLEFSDDAITWTRAFGITATWASAGNETQTFVAVPDGNDIAQLAIMGVEELEPADVDVAQLAILGILEGPPFSISLGPAFALPCWQPCTAFGTKAKVIIFR